MKLVKSVLAGVALAVSFSAIASDEMATPDEAKAMSEKAALLVNEKGEDAFAMFSAEDGGFQEKDLYVFCMDMQGVMLSHAKKPDLVGQNLIDYDKYGDKLFANMIMVAQSAGGNGWVDYKWPRPGTEEVTDKTSYVITNEKGFFCGVGAYKGE